MNVSVNTLAHWKHTCRIAGAAQAASFVPVKLVNDLRGVRPDLVVEFGGARPCIPRGCDLDQVARGLLARPPASLRGRA